MIPLPKLRELKEAIIALFSGPYTVDYPEVPTEPPEEFRGAPEFQEDGCIACGGCENVCPADAIEAIDVLDTEEPYRRMVRHFDECIYCGQCVVLCTTEEGAEHTKKYDLTTFDRREETSEVEKKFAFCSCCGEVISPMEHITWTAGELTLKSYSNPTLYMAELASIGLVDEKQVEGAIRPDEDRSKRMGLLCPACKRDAALFESNYEVPETPDYNK